METIGILENPNERYTKWRAVYLKAKLVACQFYGKLAYLRLTDEEVP